MSDILSKLSKAVNAFADVLTEDIDSKKKIGIYRYEDFVKFFKECRKENKAVEKCTISVTKVTEFDGECYPEPKFLVRIVLFDIDSRPILINGNPEELMGNVTVANAIDSKLASFMGEKTEKTVGWKGDR